MIMPVTKVIFKGQNIYSKQTKQNNIQQFTCKLLSSIYFHRHLTKLVLISLSINCQRQFFNCLIIDFKALQNLIQKLFSFDLYSSKIITLVRINPVCYILMIIEQPPTLFTISCGQNTQNYSLLLIDEVFRFVVARKDLQHKSICAVTPFKITKMLFPQIPSLSTEHAIITIHKKDMTKLVTILDKIFSQKLQWEIVKKILSYLVPKIQVFVQDRGSLCGTYIPKQRPLKVENFWLLSQTEQFSFGIYHLNSANQSYIAQKDSPLIGYLQDTKIDCISNDLYEKIMSCDTRNRQELKDIESLIVRNYDVAVICHKNIGYSFILQKGGSFKFMDFFRGRIQANQLIIFQKDKSLEVYSNICRYRCLKNYKASEIYRIRQKDTLIMGQKRFRISVGGQQ